MDAADVCSALPPALNFRGIVTAYDPVRGRDGRCTPMPPNKDNDGTRRAHQAATSCTAVSPLKVLELSTTLEETGGGSMMAAPGGCGFNFSSVPEWCCSACVSWAGRIPTRRAPTLMLPNGARVSVGGVGFGNRRR